MLRTPWAGAGYAATAAVLLVAPATAPSPAVPQGKPAGYALPAYQAPGSGPYDVTATLPDGPASASGYRVVTDDLPDSFTRLATALGLTGQPQRGVDGWREESNGATLFLSLRPGAEWRYTGFEAPPPGDAPSVKQAEAVAQPILATANGTVASVKTDGSATTVVGDPQVDGLRILGMPITVTVGRDGVTAASGHLLKPVRSSTYPLISAETAVGDLNDSPSDVAPSGTITQVRLGLVAHPIDGQPLLMPGWLLTITQPDGTMVTIGELAVDDAHLIAPIEPPAPPPPGMGTPVKIEKITPSADGRTLTLEFFGSSCDSTYTATSDESDYEVNVAVFRQVVPHPGLFCPFVLRTLKLVLRLNAPLGHRTLVAANV